MKKIEVHKTASRGIVMGNVYIVCKPELAPDNYMTEDRKEEIHKFEEAQKEVADKIQALARKNDIFEGHLALVNDFALCQGIRDKIEKDGQNAQQALENTVKEFIAVFEMMEDEYMKERAADIKDIRNRLLMSLKGIEEGGFDDICSPVILAAKDLAPSDTAKLNMNYILGFITEFGGVTSHVSIMARSLGLPALVGVGGFMQEVQDGDYVIMDAGKGIIILNPDESTVKEYEKLRQKYIREQELLKEVLHLPAETKDGHKVKICANIGSIKDVESALSCCADGVGLFRSEFLYMENSHFPTEQEQFNAYKEAAEKIEGEVIIRTLDIGGDKKLPYYNFEHEDNPFLGWRAIRISLELEEVFKTQLRALLRAGAYGDIWIMYPMMISLEELNKANGLLEECKKELEGEGVAYRKDIRVGMMIETPASVLCAAEFAKYVDFFSIGTNDLTQYLLAVDRGNEKISEMYNSFHPAVIKAIQYVIDVGHAAGIQVGMCGEFASDERAAKLLLGMGLDEFSVAAGEIAVIKNVVRNADYLECKEMAHRAVGCYHMQELMGVIS